MQRTLRIAQIAPLYESVPPSLYGGTERVVNNLTDALLKMGHEVTLFASGDSITNAHLVSACSKGLRLNNATQDELAPHVLQLELLTRMEDQFDIIHFHTDYIHLPLLKYLSTPTVTTLHGRLDQPELVSLYAQFDRTPLVSISHEQRIPIAGNNWVGNVYHGLSIDSYEPNYENHNYLTFLGRISREKGPDSAIRIATQAGVPLKIAAKIDTDDREFYQKTIIPMLDNPLVEFIGEVGEAQKRKLLSNSMGLLFPINWPEPFGMVMIEAMACGTPVVAFNHGSVPEVIDEGVTGFVVENEEQAIEKLKHLELIDRRGVRQRFEERFDQRIMASNYVRIYHNIIEGIASVDAEEGAFR